MTYTISEEECAKRDITPEELHMLLLIRMGANIPQLLKSLTEKEKAVKVGPDAYQITRRWDDEVNFALLNAEVDMKPDNFIEELAEEMQSLFPGGKKEGTKVYWKGNKRELTLRLKKFFKLYGNAYTKEQIIRATVNYVDGFNGSYSNMRVLKYFIWKDDRRMMEDGNIKVVELSELADHLENIEQEVSTHADWTSSLK